jgi:hypothetical protein
MLVDIVIAAMARLPALAHEPSRNFASVRLESWLRYGRASSLCANICASPALMSSVNIDLLPVALRLWQAAHPGGWRIHLNTRKCHRAEGIGLSAAPLRSERRLGDLEANLEQLTMNAGAPQRGFAGSSHSRDLWDANTVATASLNKRFFAAYAAAHLGQRRHSRR